GGVEGRVELLGRQAAAGVGGDQVPQVLARLEATQRRRLHDVVGLLAREAGVDQRVQDPLREDEAAQQVDVGGHALGVDDEVVEDALQAPEGVAGEGRRVGQRHAL